ncbi:MAG: hypothetical protein ACPLQO_07020 [Desulfotomaculales bacterium]
MRRCFLFLASLIGLVLVVVAGCGGPKPGSQKAAEQQVQKEMEKGVQEALRDPAQAGKAQGNVTARYKLGEEFTITFGMTEWVSEGGVTKGVSREGKSRVKVNGWEMKDKAGSETPKNGAFLVVNLTIAGDAANKGKNPNNMVTPRDFGVVGTDSAPKFSVVDAGGRQYKYDNINSSAFNSGSGELGKPSPPKRLGDVKIDDPGPKTLNIAFDVPRDLTRPVLWIECVRMSKQKEVYEVDLGPPAGQK